MAVEDRPLRLAALLGASVRAVLQAQVEAERTTLEFIREVGLNREGRVLTIDFELTQPVADPLHPGEVVPRPTRVSVPLLSIMEPPAMRIAEATLAFAVEVTDVVEGKVSPGEHDRTEPPTELIGVFAPRQEVPRRPVVTIDMKLASAPATEAYGRVQRLLGDAISAVVRTEDRPEERR